MIYNFNGFYTQEEKRDFQSAQEEDLKKICIFLKTNTDKLKNTSFEIFDTREAKQKCDPYHSVSRASASYGETPIYRFWQVAEDPHFPHEITHLVAHTWI